MTEPRFDPVTGELEGQEPRRPDLRVVGCQSCDRLRQHVERLTAEMDKQAIAFASTLASNRAQITRLQNENEDRRLQYQRRDEVELWFDVWKVATGHTKSKLGDHRFDAIRKAIELEYTIEHWELVCEYAGMFPYGPYYARTATADTQAKRRDEPHILVKHFEHFARMGWENRKRSQ